MSCLDLLVALCLVIVVVAMRKFGVVIWRSLCHSLVTDKGGGNTPVGEQSEGDNPENHRGNFAGQDSEKWFQVSGEARKNPD